MNDSIDIIKSYFPGTQMTPPDMWERQLKPYTPDQIRAAWEEANATTHLKYQNVTLLRFLEKHFDIVRCEGCGGDGDFGPTDGGVWRCPDCNGEGFKIGGGDE